MKKVFLFVFLQVFICSFSFGLKVFTDTSGRYTNILFDNNQLSNGSILNQSWDYTHKKNLISVQGSFYNQSNAVNTQLVHAILFKSFISDQMKERTFKQLARVNGYEDEANWALKYVHYSPKLKCSYSFAYSYRNMRNMVFNKESFQFVFAGNKMFEDDTINIEQLNFQYVAYNQIQVGFSKTINKPRHTLIIGAAISLLQSPQYLSLKAKNAAIYTAPYGEYLDVKYQLDVQQANRGAPEFFSFKGTGLSSDFHVSYQKNSGTDAARGNWMFRFNVYDLGFIKYSNEINSYKGDSAIKFEGIVFDNLLQLTTPNVFVNFKSDSLFKILNIENSKKSFIFIHPVTFQLAFSKALMHNKGLLTIGVQIKTQARYYPYVWGKMAFLCQRNFIPSVSVGFGGYSYYNLGVELAKKIKIATISVGSTNLLGLVAPQFFTSSSLYLRASIEF